MHINYRRLNRFNGKHHNRGPWRLVRSFAEDKAISSRIRRAQARDLIANERYDDLPSWYPRDIYWNYW